LKNTNYNALINLGFEAKEAKIYLALLELGQASILGISRKSKVNRASIYYIIEKMKQKGVVTQIKKRGTDYFMPLDPDLMYQQQRKNLKEFHEVIPELKSMVNQSGLKPMVRFFEGIEGIKAVYADTLTSKTEIINYANSQDVRKYWPEYDTEYVAERASKKIHLRGIAPDDEYGRAVKKDDKKTYRNIRLIDSKKLNFKNEIKIYDHKIAMISFSKNLFAIIIESEALADTQRSIFEMAWSFAKESQR